VNTNAFRQWKTFPVLNANQIRKVHLVRIYFPGQFHLIRIYSGISVKWKHRRAGYPFFWDEGWMSAFFADIYLNKNDVKAMVVASGIVLILKD